MHSAARRSASRRTRGLSLLEALAGTTFLSVALLGLASSSISLTRQAKTADSLSAATALAQERLEQLRSMPLDAPQLAPGRYDDPDNPLRANGTPGGRFNRSWTVSPKDTPRFGLKTVVVTLTWTDSRPQTTRLAAYVRCSTLPCP